MFCPNCGKADQTPDTYCRNCGEFLVNFSGDASLVGRVLGANTPEKRVNVGLAFDVLTFVCSLLLLIFLFGYFDGRYARTGEAAPPIVYLVYVFLGLVALWQALSFVVGVSHKSKLDERKKAKTSIESDSDPNVALPDTVKDYLPPADAADFISSSITENTTKHLDKIPRN